MEDEMDMEDQLEREMAAEEEEQLVQMALDQEYANQNPLCKEFSLPADFTFKSLPPSPLYQGNVKKNFFNSELKKKKFIISNFPLRPYLYKQAKDEGFPSTLGAAVQQNRL